MSNIIVEKDEAPDATCPLCCEAKIDVCLSTCFHESCTACMVKWVKKAEASGHQEHPTCPYCRKEISQDETTALLGRPFQPANAKLNDSSLSDVVEVDDLTLQWLEQQTKPCPHCGALIEKEEGCDLMECLCGYRFCYGCGSPGAQCLCTPDTHVFYDNVIHQNAGRAAQAQVEAPTIEETGLVDLQGHIERRLEQQRREIVQREREDRRRREKQERMEVDEMTISAKWLFCSTSRDHSLWILQQQLWLGDNVRYSRNDNQRRKKREIRNAEKGLNAVLAYGSWLFQKQGRDETLKLLAGLMEHQKRLQPREFSFFNLLIGCGQPGCPNCDWSRRREDKDARENAINIRLFFLNDEKKASELAEIEQNGL